MPISHLKLEAAFRACLSQLPMRARKQSPGWNWTYAYVLPKKGAAEWLCADYSHGDGRTLTITVPILPSYMSDGATEKAIAGLAEVTGKPAEEIRKSLEG